MKKQVSIYINFKVVKSLTKHNRTYYYLDGKRTDISKFKYAESICSSFDCFKTEIDGDIVRQYKVGKA